MTQECDLLLESFVKDMDFSDDTLSDSIFNCVDNYIDDLVEEELANNSSIFETDDANDPGTPFTFIVDRVLEKINGDIEKQAAKDTTLGLMDALSQNENDTDDHYLTIGPDFDNISPEDFQLYICNPNLDNEQECEYNTDGIDYSSSDYDSIFNA